MKFDTNELFWIIFLVSHVASFVYKLRGLWGSGTDGCILSVSTRKRCLLFQHFGCVAHIVLKACRCCHTCWTTGGSNAKFWLLTWLCIQSSIFQLVFAGDWKWPSMLHFFVWLHCKSKKSYTKICHWPALRCLSVWYVPITENNYIREQTNNW